jgi:glucose-6-phosphate 1-dehydrogenase
MTDLHLLESLSRLKSTGPDVGRIDRDMVFAEQGGGGATPCEVLLHAALRGEGTRFTRQDGVEETRPVRQPLLDGPPPVHAYAPGSRGAPDADRLTAEHGGSHSPWSAS